MSHKVQTLKLFIIGKFLLEGVFHADDVYIEKELQLVKVNCMRK